MTYEIMIAYERDQEDFGDARVRAIADELQIGDVHTTNWPCFGVSALDFIRTLEWTVQSLPDETMHMCQQFRDGVPCLRAFAVYRTAAGPEGLPVFAWQDHRWVESWKPFFGDKLDA